MTDFGGSDELRDELERVFQAMNPEHTQLSDFVDAARPVVARRVAEAKAEAWQEGHGAPECDVWVVEGMCTRYHPNPYRAVEQEGESNE